jgi:3-dehydroquinate synthase
MPTISLTPPIHSPLPYPIVIGKGVLRDLPAILRGKNPALKHFDPADHIVVLYDRRIEALAKTVASIVSTQHLIPVESGEHSKSLKELDRLASELLKIGASRATILITVGGGMMTDLGGFLASIFMRGIRVIHIPTSMLAMVDAAIGGKTAVEVGVVKNVLGTIHHPSAIICDIDALAKLPDTQLAEGIVEVVKEAAILDAKVFDWLEKSMPKILVRKEEELTRCIFEGVRMKSVVVQADDRDASHRHFLNFGHTIGHAVEAYSKFSISHGKAVSIGMAYEMKIAKTKGADRVIALMNLMKMPLEIPSDFPPSELWKIMQNDKKKKAGVVRMFVPSTIGKGGPMPLSEKEFLASI